MPGNGSTEVISEEEQALLDSGFQYSNVEVIDLETLFIEHALEDVRDELLRAISLHGPLHSAHEGYSVLLEEMDELWDHVKMKQKDRDMEAMRKEAVQVAAMALKFITQICDTGNRT